MYPGAKISNAYCRLTNSIQTRNGFVVISSKTKKPILDLIQKANDAKKNKDKLHHDHCDELTCQEIFSHYWKRENAFGPHMRQVFDDECRKDVYRYVLAMVTTLDGTKTYDFPGGKRKLGENTIDCAIRETEEETSLLLTKKNLQVKKRLLNEVNCFFLIDAQDIA